MHSQTSLLMTTVIHNVTREVKHVSCTADNGVGEAAEAAKVVTVRRAPLVTAPMLTSVTVDNLDIV